MYKLLYCLTQPLRYCFVQNFPLFAVSQKIEAFHHQEFRKHLVLSNTNVFSNRIFDVFWLWSKKQSHFFGRFEICILTWYFLNQETFSRRIKSNPNKSKTISSHITWILTLMHLFATPNTNARARLIWRELCVIITQSRYIKHCIW